MERTVQEEATAPVASCAVTDTCYRMAVAAALYRGGKIVPVRAVLHEQLADTKRMMQMQKKVQCLKQGRRRRYRIAREKPAPSLLALIHSSRIRRRKLSFQFDVSFSKRVLAQELLAVERAIPRHRNHLLSGQQACGLVSESLSAVFVHLYVASFLVP